MHRLISASVCFTPARAILKFVLAWDTASAAFCVLFGNQFTPDDVLDYYPVDRLMHDIALALMAVQTQTTEILDEFPTKAARTETAPQPEEIPQS